MSVTVYAGTWDAIVTCFFLDTAHNIVEYIEVISKILKDGGVSISNSFLFISFRFVLNTNLILLVDRSG